MILFTSNTETLTEKSHLQEGFSSSNLSAYYVPKSMCTLKGHSDEDLEGYGSDFDAGYHDAPWYEVDVQDLLNADWVLVKTDVWEDGYEFKYWKYNSLVKY